MLDEVYYKGESIIIERKGKLMAKIVPLNCLEKNKSKIVDACPETVISGSEQPAYI